MKTRYTPLIIMRTRHITHMIYNVVHLVRVRRSREQWEWLQCNIYNYCYNRSHYALLYRVFDYRCTNLRGDSWSKNKTKMKNKMLRLRFHFLVINNQKSAEISPRARKPPYTNENRLAWVAKCNSDLQIEQHMGGRLSNISRIKEDITFRSKKKAERDRLNIKSVIK